MGEHPVWSADLAAEIIARHQGVQGALLPLLHDLQACFGYIPQETIAQVALALNLSRAEVHGVVTFYHDFHEAPHGRHVLKLCRAEACQAVGGERLAGLARDRLDLDWGETTGDGAVTLEPIFCLGLCACGPAAMVDGELVGRLDPARLDQIISGLRAP
jgi:formate dehydrogenase subunit gamma